MPIFHPSHSPDLKIHYEIHGEGPETLLLLNGIMMSTRSWTPVFPRFAERYRVVLHDFRGQLSSSQPDEPYSYSQHVDDLRALLDHLKIERAHLVGTSYGSEIGMYFALRHPERTQTLTVAGGATYVDALLHAKIRAWIIATDHAIRYGEKKDFFNITLPFNFSSEQLERNRVRFQEVAEIVNQFPHSWFVAFKRLCECFLDLDLTSELPRIQAPTLAIAGTQDELKPLHYSRLIADRIPGARLATVDAGHAFVLEKTDQFTDLVLDFLGSFPKERR